MKRASDPWGCWKDAPFPHPFDPRITDTACGFDERLTDARCAGCWRSREESAADQLIALRSLGDAARGYAD